MQNRTKKRSSYPFNWVTAALVVLFLFPVPAVVHCADPGEADAGTWRYDPEGKPDPFRPFIQIGEKTGKAGEHQEVVVLPPLQRFGTEAFRLTGIVLTGSKRIAMVVAPEGKRHILRRGTRIGINNGRVIKILSDSVIVLEEIKDFEGNINTERIILTLRKNGGDS